MMKKSMVAMLALAVVMSFSLVASAAPNFGGKWKWEKDGQTFVIELVQKAVKEKGQPPIMVKGSHKAMGEDGSKVDSSNGEISIFSDNYVDGAILVKIRSYASNTEGRAMMRIEGAKGEILLFQIVSPPEGESFIPTGNIYMKKVAPEAKKPAKKK